MVVVVLVEWRGGWKLKSKIRKEEKKIKMEKWMVALQGGWEMLKKSFAPFLLSRIQLCVCIEVARFSDLKKAIEGQPQRNAIISKICGLV